MKEYKTVFDQLAEEYDFWKCTIKRVDEYQTIVDFLPWSTETVLDVGCGTGQLALYLADFTERITGIDSAAAMIRLAKQHQEKQAKRNIQFIHAAVETWVCEAQQFDFIISDKALHHTDLSSVLPKLRHWLRPGGRILIRDFAATDVARWRKPYWQYKQAWRELRGFKEYDWKVWWRLARFRLSPTWIRHVCQDEILSMPQTKAIYQQHFPGCTLIELEEQILMLWENIETV